MEYCPPSGQPPIIYADEHLLVVNKVAELLSVPGRGDDKQDCLITRVQQDYPDALTVHRLDLSTSGLLVLARRKEVQAALSKAFADKQVDKRYIALVDGLMKDDDGLIDLPLICDWPNRPRQKVCHEQGKNAQTRFKVIKRDSTNNTSRVALYPITGRSHQLRVHLLSQGHVILGDNLYAAGPALDNWPRLHLHAEQLGFTHPLTGEHLHFSLPAPF